MTRKRPTSQDLLLGVFADASTFSSTIADLGLFVSRHLASTSPLRIWNTLNARCKKSRRLAGWLS